MSILHYTNVIISRFKLPLVVSIFSFIAPINIIAQNAYPTDVTAVLEKAGVNRIELEKTIQYFFNKNDSMQLNAAYFLIANMDIHESYNYYWADSSGKRLLYNELDFPDFDSAIRGFEVLKKETPKIHPVPFKYKDMDSIKSGMLIENIEKAFALWKQPYAQNLSFADFCEYLLPYRVSIEPLQNWRTRYEQYFKNLKESIKNKSLSEAIAYWTKDCHNWFSNTYNNEERKEPLPRLGALQLISRKKGPCEDFTDLGVFEARALGIASTVEYIPAWATSTGSHFFDVAFTGTSTNIPYEQLEGDSLSVFHLRREPGKVVRLTYSKQSNTLAYLTSKENIPDNFLRTVNYKDVTEEYWETQDFSTPLFSKNTISKSTDKSREYAFACVLNTLNWRPIWWGTVKNDSCLFKNMGKGVVYLPMQYDSGKLQPAGYPYALGYRHNLILQPDSLNKHTIRLAEQEKYLRFRPGKNYKLLYWDKSWKLLGSQTATESTTELIFSDVPKNALLLLLPEYSQHKERPFIITDLGERVWW